MTKADIVTRISEKLGIEKGDVQATVESRAEKTGRNISKNTTIKIPAHNIPAFKPAKVFVEGVKTNVQVK